MIWICLATFDVLSTRQVLVMYLGILQPAPLIYTTPLRFPLCVDCESYVERCPALFQVSLFLGVSDGVLSLMFELQMLNGGRRIAVVLEMSLDKWY
jgi:hypothetical protein